MLFTSLAHLCVRVAAQVEFEPLRTVAEFCSAIADMHVRGAGCIGVTAGYGMYCAAVQARKDAVQRGEGEGGVSDEKDVTCFLEAIDGLGKQLARTRPTAANLKWAVERQLAAVRGAAGGGVAAMVSAARDTAARIADEDVEWCKSIGQHGLGVIRSLLSDRKPGDTFNILTHCNAGWLAFADYGTATGPIYAAQEAGLKVHVWVDETRPRNQGASLTAWELLQQGVDHTVIADNTGGHLMQHGMVDMVIVGADRVTSTGDVANKIGTYLKALAAKDCGVPFYVAFGSSALDHECKDGLAEIPIEQRSPDEVAMICGKSCTTGELHTIRVVPDGSAAANYAFDVTPARLVTGLITERGVCAASEEGLAALYPERRHA
mmetsp:Transcript_17689/g.45295  ORF Transcript_17689/g.45295 Transcript_17689/m.45295 type:complete len:377 (-) Transcript_17689:311-1441(-)